MRQIRVPSYKRKRTKHSRYLFSEATCVAECSSNMTAEQRFAFDGTNLPGCYAAVLPSSLPPPLPFLSGEYDWGFQVEEAFKLQFAVSLQHKHLI